MRRAFWAAALGLIGALAPPASAQGLPPGLRHQGTLADGAELRHPEYRFTAAFPGARLGDSGWQHFANAQGSTVLVGGLQGVESFALAVVRLRAAAPGATALDVARRERPSVGAAMQMAPDGLPCAVMPEHEPIPLGQGLVLVMAVCVNPVNRAAYDLSLSIQSMPLRVTGWDALQAQEKACAAEAQPGRTCRDTDAALRNAMAGLLSSWRFMTAMETAR